MPMSTAVNTVAIASITSLSSSREAANRSLAAQFNEALFGAELHRKAESLIESGVRIRIVRESDFMMMVE